MAKAGWRPKTSSVAKPEVSYIYIYIGCTFPNTFADAACTCFSNRRVVIGFARVSWGYCWLRSQNACWDRPKKRTILAESNKKTKSKNVVKWFLPHVGHSHGIAGPRCNASACFRAQKNMLEQLHAACMRINCKNRLSSNQNFIGTVMLESMTNLGVQTLLQKRHKWNLDANPKEHTEKIRRTKQKTKNFFPLGSKSD